MRIILNWSRYSRHIISITSSPWTGGTATFVPATGTSYTLSELPEWTTIASWWSYLSLVYNNAEIWRINVTPSSWYQIYKYQLTRWWITTTLDSTAVQLNNGDIVVESFEATVSCSLEFIGNGEIQSSVRDAIENTLTEYKRYSGAVPSGFDFSYMITYNGNYFWIAYCKTSQPSATLYFAVMYDNTYNNPYVTPYESNNWNINISSTEITSIFKSWKTGILEDVVYHNWYSSVCDFAEAIESLIK